MNRRQFAKAATASAMLAATATGPASAAQPEISTEAQALYEMIRIHFGQHLDEAQLKRVRASIEAGLISWRAGCRKFPRQPG